MAKLTIDQVNCKNKKVLIRCDFNVPLDENLKIKLNEVYFFKKMSFKNDWKQISFEESKNIKYNRPFKKVNGLVIGVMGK